MNGSRWTGYFSFHDDEDERSGFFLYLAGFFAKVLGLGFRLGPGPGELGAFRFSLSLSAATAASSDHPTHCAGLGYCFSFRFPRLLLLTVLFLSRRPPGHQRKASLRQYFVTNYTLLLPLPLLLSPVDKCSLPNTNTLLADGMRDRNVITNSLDRGFPLDESSTHGSQS